MKNKLRLLSGLKIWQKLVLIAVFMGLPIPLIAYLYVGEKNNDISFGQQEIYGVDYVRLAAPILQNVQKHRLMNTIYARGDKTINDQLTKQTQLVEESIRALEALEEQDAGGRKYAELLGSTDKFATIKNKWEDIKRRQYNFTSEESFTAHTDLCAEIQDLIARVGDVSNLTLDPGLDSYYLMESVINQIPKASENLGQMRAITVGIATAKQKTLVEEKQLALLAGRTTENLRNIAKGIPKAINYNNALKTEISPLLNGSTNLAESFLEMAEKRIIASQTIDADSREFLTTSTNAIDEIFKFNTVLADNLEKLLKTRIGAFTWERNLVLLLMLVGIALTVFLVALVTREVTRQLGSLTKLIGEMESGNIDARAEVISQDELGRAASAFNKMLDNTRGLMQSRDERDRIQQSIMKLLDEVSNVAQGDLTREAEVTADITGAIADAFNYMIVNLRELIGKVQNVSLQVTSTASETQTAAERLAQGSQEQAAQIINTSTALTEMTGAMQKVSESAEQSAKVADQSLTTARKGAEAVHNTVQGMTRIQEQVQETARRIRQLHERSQEIEEIVSLIDEIADRTGVLALNASIQAATAGEAGQGFAVVAHEVEQLAGRSAEATKRISNLIRAIQGGTNEAITAMEETTREVVSGARIANQAGQSLTEIEAVSNRLAELVRSISHSCQQQARSSEMLSRTMTQIASITNQTTSGVIQSAETVRGLAGLADELRASVASFKVTQNNYNGHYGYGAYQSNGGAGTGYGMPLR